MEIRTKYVALEADCMIDCLVMDQNQMLIKNGFSSGNNSSKMFPDEAIHRIINEFESIQEEALKKIIEDVKANEEAQQSTLVRPSSPKRSAPGRVDKNTTMVGFEQHLVAVMERVTGHAFTLQILPILGMGALNLQTLLIEETPVGNEPLVLPLEIWEMARLRHLIIKQVAIPDPSIAHDVDVKEGPILANLQTLQDVHCFKLSEEVVKRIPNLKKLKLTYTKASESTVEWSYYGLHNLAKLCKLKSLSFAVREKITALELSLPLSLRKLILDGCKLPWEEMTMVGSLPNLEVLRLQNDAFCGREWKPIEGEFCHLKVLHLRNMSFQQWEADRTHFPRLERLILYNVWWLKKIPLDIGDIPTLQFISADCCRSSLEVSVEQLIE